MSSVVRVRACGMGIVLGNAIHIRGLELWRIREKNFHGVLVTAWCLDHKSYDILSSRAQLLGSPLLPLLLTLNFFDSLDLEAKAFVSHVGSVSLTLDLGRLTLGFEKIDTFNCLLLGYANCVIHFFTDNSDLRLWVLSAS